MVRFWVHVQGFRIHFRGLVQGKESGLGFVFGFRAFGFQFQGVRFWAQIRITFNSRFRVRFRVKL